jgi:hypothetical protein
MDLTILKLNKVYTFDEFLAQVNLLASRHDTTGTEKSTDRIEATRLNAARMSRIYKTVRLNAGLTDAMRSIDKPMIWLLILESWCGDGAQTAPVIARAAALSPLVSLKVILRDDNPDIMDKYLTDGKRSIPKLVFFDTGTLGELSLWGPRTQFIQSAFLSYKSENPGLDHAQLMKELHSLYAKDQTLSLQLELEAIVRELVKKQDELVTL